MGGNQFTGRVSNMGFAGIGGFGDKAIEGHTAKKYEAGFGAG